MSTIPEAHMESIDVIGSVTMVRTDRMRFGLRLTDGAVPIEAPLPYAAETAVLAALSASRVAKVRVRGRGAFATGGRLKRIFEVWDVQLLPAGEPCPDEDSQPIWETIRTIMADVPDDELATIPSSTEIDSVVYGSIYSAR